MVDAKSSEALERTVAAVADEADADVRSVWKRLAGGRLRPKTERRVDRALASHGLAPSSDNGSTPPPRAA